MEKISSLGDNEYFSAGFGLIGIGALLTVVRKSTNLLDLAMRKCLTTTIEVPSKDKSYQWILYWLSKQRMMANKHTMVETEFKQLDTGKIVSKYSFPPATGIHYMFYKGLPLQIERSREKSMIDFTRAGAPFETIVMKSLGRNSDIFVNILNEAREMVQDQNEGKTVTYICSGSEWTQFGYPKKRRPLSSVILEDNLADSIFGDIKEFIENPKWYIERGIPYRRGYLLYGPPGCGKSSFITAIAGEIYYNLCVLNLSERGLSDDRLHYLLNTAPPQSIVVLEDIDCAISHHNTEDAYRVSRSGLLNSLDGVASSEERIIFMTTNFFEKLDSALMRPGRVDVVHKIGYITTSQIKRLFSRFYPEAPHQMSTDFSVNVSSLNIKLSPAQLQGYLLKFKNCPQSAFDNFKNLINIH